MDYATTLNIDQQGRIIIPAKVRKALQLHTGDVLMLEADTRNICLRKYGYPVRQFSGYFT